MATSILQAFAGKYKLERTANFEDFLQELKLPPTANRGAQNAVKGTLELIVSGHNVSVKIEIGNLRREPYTIVVGGDAQEIDFMGYYKTYAKAKISNGTIEVALEPPHSGGPVGGGKPAKIIFDLKGTDELEQTIEIGDTKFQQWFRRTLE